MPIVIDLFPPTPEPAPPPCSTASQSTTWRDTPYVQNGTWVGDWPDKPTLLDRLRAWCLLPSLDAAGGLVIGNLERMDAEDCAGVERWLNVFGHRQGVVRELRLEASRVVTKSHVAGDGRRAA